MYFLRLILFIIAVAVVISSCDILGDSENSFNDERKNTKTTNENGVVKFKDNETDEEVEIKVRDKNDNPVQNINVQFIDDTEYEVFISEDPEGEFLTSADIFLSNSVHTITMSVQSDIEEVEEGTDKYQALKNFTEDEGAEWIERGCRTPEEIASENEIYATLFTFGSLSTFYTVTGKFNDIIGEISDVPGPKCYHTFEIVPDNPITTSFRHYDPAKGDITVSTSTSGDELDEDGYDITVENFGSKSIGLNDEVEIMNVFAGSRTVQLDEIDPDCSVDGNNPKSVSVPVDGELEVSFSVTCGTGNSKVTKIGSHDGNEYYASKPDTLKNWNEARDVADELGGHLVTISNQDEQDFVFQGVEEYNTALWIGFTDRQNEGEWKWVTGEDVTYTNWDSGEPNDLGTEDAAVLRPNSEGRWNDADIVNDDRGFVVEIEQ